MNTYDFLITLLLHLGPSKTSPHKLVFYGGALW
jgi:hypothetical protein